MERQAFRVTRGAAWGSASTHTYILSIIYTVLEITSCILRRVSWESLTSGVSPCVWLCYVWQTGWAGVSFPQGLALKPASQ